jgi:hypothetical protein
MGNRILELKERVFSYVDSKGPALPSIMAREFRSTSLFISALLSELVTEKRIKLTKAKIGGSPLYYVSKQNSDLVKLLKNHIGQKPKEALDLLKEKRVLRDRDCLPFERVALRELEDFAKPVRLVVQETEEIFWKWFLLEDDEAKNLIESMLEVIYSPKKKEEPIIEDVVVQEAIEVSSQKNLSFKDELEITEVLNNSGTQTKLLKKEAKKVIIQKETPKKKRKVKSKVVEKDLVIDTDFEKVILQYLKKKKIKVLDKSTVKKDREFNYIVSVPSNAGDLRYFVKARKKKTLNEGDLLLAFTEGQDKKLSTIYLSNAEITKKAKSYVEKSLPGLNYIKIE